MIIPTHNPFENNLHHCVNDFMAGDYDYWLSIDADNPPLRNPLDLIEYDRDVIGLPTPVWHYDEERKLPGERPIYLAAYDYAPEKDAYKEHQPQEGLQRVDAVGTGCFLVSRRVFSAPRMREAPFSRTLNGDGTVNKGNDIAFCERARAEGFEIFAHYDYTCRHFNELELTEVGRAFMNWKGGENNG